MDKVNETCPISIENLEPFFIWQFGIKTPNNLKPNLTSVTIKKTNGEAPKLFSDSYVKCTGNCFTNCRKDVIFKLEIEQLLKYPNDNIRFNNFWKSYPRVFWLTNELGVTKKITGLSVKALEELDEGLYQIGMQSTTTKEYFRYISTSRTRKINIRMILFNQYSNLQNKGDKAELAGFLNRFNEFENLISSKYDSIIFHFDVYGEKFFKIKTKEGIEIQDEDFGLDIDFNKWIEKIKAAESKG